MNNGVLPAFLSKGGRCSVGCRLRKASPYHGHLRCCHCRPVDVGRQRYIRYAVESTEESAEQAVGFFLSEKRHACGSGAWCQGTHADVRLALYAAKKNWCFCGVAAKRLLEPSSTRNHRPFRFSLGMCKNRISAHSCLGTDATADAVCMACS